ncbi:hypothetical protein BS78_03G153600 [Paspalum vaginatum]|nr:hypothetical protein BS78_03G153600 [Paspalum vaginatum]
MENTLDPREMVGHHPSYWSSGGQDDPDVPESLTYWLHSRLFLVDEIRIRPYQVYFYYSQPIFSSKMVRFQIGRSKLPYSSAEVNNQSVIADENYVWTYTSPEFPMAQENVLQSFKLPHPVLCIDGVVRIELLGRTHKAIDDLYYICICHVQVIGRSLSPVFMVHISESAGYTILKCLPGARK